MFGLWEKKKKSYRIVAPNAVYMYRSMADEALVQSAEASDLPVIVTSFFPASLSRIALAFKEAGMAPQHLGTGGFPRYENLDATPWLLKAELITAGLGFDNWLRRSERECLFLFVEHHPLINVEDASLDVLEKIAESTMQRAIFFCGMDEPLMRLFGADRLVALMKSMGMAETEKISHPMVDKALLNARKKIEKNGSMYLPADSDAEWFERNYAKKLL